MKKTILSFLCIGSTCMLLAQQTKLSSDTNVNRNNTTTNSVNQQSTLNNNNNTPNNGTNRNSTINGTQANPATSGSGTVNGHNTMMDEKRNYPGNSNMNNVPANSTLNGHNGRPVDNGNGNTGNGNTMDANSGTLRTTSNNAAYSVTVPTSVQTSFQATYPAAGNVTWQQSGDWYRVRYMENGKLMEGSYREDGKSFSRAASPIMKTYVPEEAVNKAMEMYGMNVYAIARTKGTDGQDIYNVTVIENGQSRTEWMSEDGSTVMSPYRTEMDEQGTQNKMNRTSEQQVTDENATPETDTTDQKMQAEQPAEPAEKKEQQNPEDTDPQQPEPDNRSNDNGINNGTGSDTLMRRMNNQNTDNNGTRTPEDAEPIRP